MADAPPSVCVSTDRPVPCISSSRSSRLRVLVLAQLPPPEHGASAVNRQVVSSKILSETFELAVIPISMTGDLARLRKFDVMKIWRSLALFGTVAGQLFGLGRPPDIVYFTLSPGGWAFYRDLALITLIRIAGIRCLFHLHGRGIAQSIESAPWRRRLYRFAFARSFVVTLSESLRGDIRGLVRQDQIFVVPNGVDDAVATQRHSEDVGAAQRPNNRVPRLLFVSNMLEEKGPLVLLEALAMVARRGVRFEARFAGAWRQSVSQERFEARVRELALQDRVEHRGPVYGSEKTRLFADSDLFVLPTYYRHEALPLVVIEAMMHGLPVVTTRIGALPEIIADKLNGELVEPGNIAQLGSALLKLLTDPDLCARYGRAARLKYEADLTAQRFEERLRDALLQVANRT
ncbi:MAG: glycosyltransferase family 4 protein [Xanthobacteraceae bacterium]